MEPDRQQVRRRRRATPPSPWRHAGMGMELAASIAAFTLIGYWVDHEFGTGSVGVITGAIVGSVGGLYVFIRRALQMAPRDEIEEEHREANRTDGGGDGD